MGTGRERGLGGSGCVLVGYVFRLPGEELLLRFHEISRQVSHSNSHMILR